MDSVNYLNVGCGNKFYQAWTNIGTVAADPAVRAANLIEGIPHDTATFNVGYPSQVLEPIPKASATAFIAECLGTARTICNARTDAASLAVALAALSGECRAQA